MRNKWKFEGANGEPKCPKCQNSSQNAVPSGSPNLRRCASCKEVWEPQLVDKLTRITVETSQKGEELLEEYKNEVDMLVGMVIEMFGENKASLLSPVMRKLMLEKGKSVDSLRSKLHPYLHVDYLNDY